MVLLPQEAGATVSIVCAVIATASAVFVAFRDTMWRKRGLAKELSDRIDAAHKAADRWHETEPARALRAEIDRHSHVLAEHDGCLLTVATKEDVREITVAAAQLRQRVETAAGGIDRIEGLLIRRALAGAGAG